MKPLKHLARFAILTGMLLSGLPANAYSWLQTSAPGDNYWQSIASSSDGAKLAAVTGYPNNGHIYISTNSGSNWVQTSALSLQWSAIACSADGNRLIAVPSQSGASYISTDGGSTWTNTTATHNPWTSAASSADGSHLVTLTSLVISTSTNFGATWNLYRIPGVALYQVASSANGIKLAAVVNQGAIYTSSDAGVTWISNSVPAPIVNFSCIASSADGNRLLAGIGGNGGSLYISTDSGAHWHSNNVPRQVWSSVTSSADGSHLAAAGYPAIYISTNFGANWTSNQVSIASWHCLASSTDGSKLVGGVISGPIWAGQNSPAPRLNLQPHGGNILFSWTLPTTNFNLQQSPDLASWSDITTNPTLNPTTLQNEITLPASNPSGFYRLKTP